MIHPQEVILIFVDEEGTPRLTDEAISLRVISEGNESQRYALMRQYKRQLDELVK